MYDIGSNDAEGEITGNDNNTSLAFHDYIIFLLHVGQKKTHSP